MEMKKGIVMSIDVFLASLIVIIFISSFVFYGIKDNVEEKIAADKTLDTLALLETDFVFKNTARIEENIEKYMEDDNYQLVVDYYNPQGSKTGSIIVGNDLSNVLAVSRFSFVIMDSAAVSEFGIASLRVST